MRYLREPKRVIATAVVVLFSLGVLVGCATTRELAALQEQVNRCNQKASSALETAEEAKSMVARESANSEASALRAEAAADRSRMAADRSEIAASQAQAEADRAEAMAKKAEAIFLKKMKK